MRYGEITIAQLVLAVTNNPKFPNGLQTPIATGDFEGNAYHKRFALMREDEGACLFLGYEQHEIQDYENEGED